MAKSQDVVPELFDDAEQAGCVNRYCQIVWNGKITERKFLSFLEPDVYDRITAVTYVSSPRFLLRATSGFQRVTLVLGIPEGRIAKEFEFLNPNNSLKFWNELTDEQRSRVIDRSIEVRYARKGNAIHSKIYLLSGSGGRRVLMGSANLTQNAIQGSQYEEVIVSDDPSMCDIYEQRVEQILKETVDYIPEEAKRRVTAIDLTTASPDVFNRVLQEVIAQERIGLVIPADRVEEIKENVDEVAEEQDNVVLLRNIVKEIAVPLSPGKQVITTVSLGKKYEHIRRLFVRAKKSDTTPVPDVLPVLTVGSDMRLYRDGNVQEPFAVKPLDGLQVGVYLDRIGKFMDAYRQFTVEDSALLANQRSVGEAILYSFFSPFLWKEREDIKEKGLGAAGDVPPFLLLAGKAWSGKTHLLRFISVLLGGDEEYYHYERLSPAMIRGLLEQTGKPFPNVFPLLIDEVDKAYFSGSGNSGEGMLKYLADELSGIHPCFIGTTNNTFRGNSQVVRRMYYLETTSTFKQDLRSKSERFFQDAIDGLDAGLFKDFAVRVQDHMKNMQDWYDGIDYLAPARNVFRDYYMLAQRDVPAWFSDKILDNYYDRGRRIWGDIYRKNKRLFHAEGRYVKVDPRDLWPEGFEKYAYVKLLPSEVTFEDQGIIVLYQKEFFKFLRIRPARRLFDLLRLPLPENYSVPSVSQSSLLRDCLISNLECSKPDNGR